MTKKNKELINVLEGSNCNAMTKDGGSKTFEMPENCRFCSPCCGNCIYYETVNFSGYCNYHKKWVSSGGGPCSAYT